MDNIIKNTQRFYSTQDLRNVLKLLWSQNNMWTRFYIISAFSKLADIEYVKNRLLENPRDFANVFRIYYGDAIAYDIENLFREHLTLTIDLINSYASGNESTENIANRIKTEKLWYENADNLANFLSGINPNWDKHQLQNLFFNQLDMTKDEIVKRSTRQFAADVYLYDFIEYYALMMADIMADGIIKQFYPK